jgi:hypothetical protein
MIPLTFAPHSLLSLSITLSSSTGPIIGLDSEEHFMWPLMHVGYRTTMELDGQQISITTLSEAPRVFLMENFLSEAECDYMVEHVKQKEMEQSKIGETAEASVYDNIIRTSTNTW